ncbi:MAG: sel1 repeat family protein [Epsilonproteobacteria bacterium]|nr:sel1 repeat family protein [Campylobacterota bacterium]
MKKTTLKILTGLTILSLAQLAQARPAPSDAHKALDKKNSSFRNLILDCTERNISLSCHRAGVFYISVRKEFQKGIDYLNQSCELGRGYSCTVLGDYYSSGNIVAKNSVVAKSYYNKGCVRESEEGCQKWGGVVIVPQPKKKDPLDILNQ